MFYLSAGHYGHHGDTRTFEASPETARGRPLPVLLGVDARETPRVRWRTRVRENRRAACRGTSWRTWNAGSRPADAPARASRRGENLGTGERRRADPRAPSGLIAAARAPARTHVLSVSPAPRAHALYERRSRRGLVLLLRVRREGRRQGVPQARVGDPADAPTSCSSPASVRVRGDVAVSCRVERAGTRPTPSMGTVDARHGPPSWDPHGAAGPALGHLVRLSRPVHEGAADGGPYHFFLSASCRIVLSKVRSTTRPFNLRFSSRSWRSSRSSLTPSAPKRFFQRE